MLVCPIIPFALPLDRILTRPVAHTFATLVFRISCFRLLNNKYARPARGPVCEIVVVENCAALDYSESKHKRVLVPF